MHSLDSIHGVGKVMINTLGKLDIYSIEDLLCFYPFRYEVIKRSDLYHDNLDKVIIDGRLVATPSVFYINKSLNKMSFKIETDNMIISVTIFNRAYLKSKLKVGEYVTLFGKYDRKHNMLTANNIRLGKIPVIPKIEPVYHTVSGLTSKKIESFIDINLEYRKCIKDYIPNEIKEKYKFLNKEDSILELHKPSSIENLKKARLRSKYEELFVFMIKMEYLKNSVKDRVGLPKKIDYNKVLEFINNLPFSLTEDQKKSVDDIYNDMTDSKRMNRLLQGDVGSGKTIISVISMYMNYLAGYQSALMAPTEILAVQHFNNINGLLSKYGINVAILTGKTKAKEKKEICKGLSDGSINIVIGTHALISENVIYNNLGLVVTDEQHRFGVRQRGSLQNKGVVPDILYMSATPIPRTYALTLYGDMDVSNIKTRPSGRLDIITKVKKESEIKDVLESMYKELLAGHQIYVIAPLIEESEKMDLKDVNLLYDKMNLAFGKKFNIGLLHGKMSGTEKEEVMKKFEKNETQILISTTVIEVGVDVPNTTMIVIFDAYRFGLSTLHQLRGRVGRNSLQSYCFLISNYEKERLKVMEETNDGFKISEEDFKLRGSGDLFGLKQSGDMSFNLADIKNDFNILKRAKEDCEEYLKNNMDSDIVKDVLSNSLDMSS